MPTKDQLLALAAEWITQGEAMRGNGQSGQAAATARIGCAQALIALVDPDA